MRVPEPERGTPAAPTGPAATTAGVQAAIHAEARPAVAAPVPARPPPATPGWGRRVPAVVFGSSFVSLLTLLLIRNRVLFSVAVHERGDFAANSILVGQAKHLDLLVGNYSRLGFSHPGPAYFYWQALGEGVFHDLLSLVPAPWNGQYLALLALNSALVALTLSVIASWTRSGPAVAACAAAMLFFFTTHGQLLSSAWMPYLYLAPFLLLLAAVASVAAGRTAHLWVVALAGGLLVHGHVEFLLFVPALAGAAVAALWYRDRRGGTGGRLPGSGSHWLRAAAVAAVFLLPIVLNLGLHWPGEFGKYLSYGDSRDVHPAAATAGYVLRFWADGPVPAVVLALVLFGIVAATAGLAGRGPLRRFLIAGAGTSALAAALFAGYTARGIDDLTQDYVGYFSEAIPLLLLVLAVLGLAAAGLPQLGRAGQAKRSGWALAGVSLLVAVAAAGRSGALVSPLDHLPDAPKALAALSAESRGQPVVLDLDHDSWPVMTALIVEGERSGQRVCVRDPAWQFMVTAASVCTPRQLADGCRVLLSTRPAMGTALGRLGPSTLIAERGPC